MRHRNRLTYVKLALFVFSLLLSSILTLNRTHAIDNEVVLSLNTGMPGKVTITSISQDGIELEKKYDAQDNIYYYPSKRSSSSIQFKIRPENLEDNYLYNLNYSCDDNSQCINTLTPEDNGKDIIVSAVPNYPINSQGLNMGYGMIEFGFARNHTQYERSAKFIILPSSIGSDHVIIESMSQNGNELEYVKGYYKISDYNAPINVTYKITGLTINYIYDTFLGAGNGAGSGRGMTIVDTHEKTVYDSFYLDPTVDKNICRILLWENENYEISGESNETIRDTVSVPFKYTSDFVGFDTIIIDRVTQNEAQIEAQNGYFTLNTKDDIKLYIHTNSAMDNTYYLIGFDASSPHVFSGKELKEGVVLDINPRELKANYERNSGTYTLNSFISSIQDNPYSIKQLSVKYGTSNNIKLKFIDDIDKESFDSVKMYYDDGTEVQCSTNIYNSIYSCLIESERYESSKTIKVMLSGTKYNDDAIYNATVSLDRNNHRNINYGIYEYTASVLGSEINNGAIINLENLALTQMQTNYHYPYRNSQYYLILHIDNQKLIIPFNYKKKDVGQSNNSVDTETIDNANQKLNSDEKNNENTSGSNKLGYSSVKFENGKYIPITLADAEDSNISASHGSKDSPKQDAYHDDSMVEPLGKETENNTEQSNTAKEESSTPIIVISVGSAIVIVGSAIMIFLRRKV